MKRLIYFLICFYVLSSAAFADTMYVSDILKIMLRSGPGIDYKITKVLRSGQEVEIVEVLEADDEWTKVRLPDGKEGWVKKIYITPEKTARLLLDNLEKKHKQVTNTLAEIKEQNRKYKEENRRLAAEIAATRKKLGENVESYETLKAESSDFLKLKEKYEKASALLSERTEKANELERKLHEKNIYLYLLGGGMCFFGFLMGIRTKRKRYRTSLG